MPDEQNEQAAARPLFYRPAPGYWRTRAKLKRAKRLQDLIRHNERWASDIDLAQPLEELLPDVPKDKYAQTIQQEINRLLRLVHWDLNYFGTPTSYVYKDRYIPETEPEHYDVILDYFRLPRVPGSVHVPFNAVMRTLNEGIGVMEAHLVQMRWEIINPIAWIAHFIRLPITVMERAGFIGHEKTENLMLGSYATLMKIAMSLILALIAVRLGVSIPWKELILKLLDLIGK